MPLDSTFKVQFLDFFPLNLDYLYVALHNRWTENFDFGFGGFFSVNILPVLKLELSLTLNLSKKVNPLYPSAVRKIPSLKIYTNINEPKIFDLL